MATIDLTEATFAETIAADGIVLVDWWASWCGPCRMFAPIFSSVADQHPDITFAKVDTEAERRLAGMFGISSIPTLVAFRDKIVVFSQAGALPAPALEQVISGVRELDMDDVRRQIEAQQSEQERARASVADLAAAHAQGAVVIDVRERHEYLAGHLADAQLMPMNTVPARVQDLPTDRPVYVICQTGARSSQATAFLRSKGVDAINVEGGMSEWERNGYAVTRGA